MYIPKNVKDLYSAHPLLWGGAGYNPVNTATDSVLAYLSSEFVAVYGDMPLGEEREKYKSFKRDFSSVPRNTSDTDGGVLTFRSMWDMLRKEMFKICRESSSPMGQLNIILPKKGGVLAEKAIVVLFSKTETVPCMWSLYMSRLEDAFSDVSESNPAQVFVLEV